MYSMAVDARPGDVVITPEGTVGVVVSATFAQNEEASYRVQWDFSDEIDLDNYDVQVGRVFTSYWYWYEFKQRELQLQRDAIELEFDELENRLEAERKAKEAAEDAAEDAADAEAAAPESASIEYNCYAPVSIGGAFHCLHGTNQSDECEFLKSGGTPKLCKHAKVIPADAEVTE